MKRLRAFTLAETLVTLAIIGVIAVIVLPVIKDMVPNKEMVMFKKAYFLTSRAVTELINDEDYYPENPDPDNNGQGNGFAHTNIGPEGSGAREREATVHGNAFFGPEKFCNLFASKFNLREPARCNERIDVNDGGNFETTDGMIWNIPVSNFSEPQTIFVDVNGRGSKNGPNCGDAATGADPCTNERRGHDRFAIIVHSDGTLEVPSAVAREYLRSQRTNRTYQQVVKDLEKEGKQSE